MPVISIKKDLKEEKSLKNVFGNPKQNVLVNTEHSSAWPSLAVAASVPATVAVTPGTLPSLPISSNTPSNGIGGGGKKDWKKIDIPIRHANDHPSSKKKGSSKSKRDHPFHSSNYKDSSNNASSQFHYRFSSQSSSTSNQTQQPRKKAQQPRRMGRTRSQMSYQEQPEIDQVQILTQWIIYQL